MPTFGVSNRRAGVPVTGNLATPAPVTPAGALQSGAPMTMNTTPTLQNFTAPALLQNYNQALTQSQNANKQMYNNILGGYQNLQNQVGGQYGQLTNNLLNSYGQNAQNMLGGYQQRYDRNMGYIQNAGAQQTADINAAYNAQGATTQNQLAGEGLAGTTIAPTMAAGNERNRQADLARLNQGLLQQKLNTDSSLSGDTLQAQNNVNNTQTGMAKELGQAQIGAQAGLGQNQLNFQERVQQPAPDMNLLANTMTNLGRYGGAAGAGTLTPNAAPAAPISGAQAMSNQSGLPSWLYNNSAYNSNPSKGIMNKTPIYGGIQGVMGA